MMVHCSTTMASYVWVAASASLASWKMKTLSTDFGSKSKEKNKEKKKNGERWSHKESIYWMECVCLAFASSSDPPG